MTALRPALAAVKILLVFTVLLGMAYPALVTGLARLMPGRADGSLLLIDGRVVGSALLGQAVTDPRFFQGRPSASDASGLTSGGSNLGPNDPDLTQAVADREAAVRAANPEGPGASGASVAVPADALTASASGLDSDISPAYAAWQAPRVAAATGLALTEVQSLVGEHTAYPALGFIGSERVNVTELNAALAQRLDR